VRHLPTIADPAPRTLVAHSSARKETHRWGLVPGRHGRRRRPADGPRPCNAILTTGRPYDPSVGPGRRNAAGAKLRGRFSLRDGPAQIPARPAGTHPGASGVASCAVWRQGNGQAPSEEGGPGGRGRKEPPPARRVRRRAPRRGQASGALDGQPVALDAQDLTAPGQDQDQHPRRRRWPSLRLPRRRPPRRHQRPADRSRGASWQAVFHASFFSSCHGTGMAPKPTPTV